MSWLLKSKRLQSAGNNTTGIYSLGNNSNTSGSSFSNNNNYSTGNGSSNNLLNSAPSHSFFLHQHLSSNNLHHHLDAGEDMVRQFAASQLDTQKTAFMRWVNVQLANTPYTPMAAIEKDLRDGKRLIGLLEAVSKEPLKPERGNMRIHQMANVSNALAFLEKRTDDALGTIGNEDIVDGNIKLTLGLVWIIIYRFQIQQIANNMAELYPILAEDMMVRQHSRTSTIGSTPPISPCSFLYDFTIESMRSKGHGYEDKVAIFNQPGLKNERLFATTRHLFLRIALRCYCGCGFWFSVGWTKGQTVIGSLSVCVCVCARAFHLFISFIFFCPCSPVDGRVFERGREKRMV